jgi:hypothetical protein
VFNGNGRLYRLKGGALVELDFVKAPVERASVYDIVVVDSGRLLRAYDPSGRVFLELPKEPSVSCYATRYGILCCRSGLCGLIEPGVSTINIEAYNNEGHELRVVSDVPLLLNYGDKQHYVRPGELLVIREEKASVLRRYAFELEALGREVSEGPSTICTDRNPDTLIVEAVDTVSGDRVRVVDLRPERVFIPEPKYTFNVEHREESSTIELRVEDGELVKAVLKCRNGEAPLEPGANIVRDCTLPAEVHLTLRKRGFIHKL